MSLSHAGRFRAGITPDFYTEAKGRFEAGVSATFDGVPYLDYAPLGAPDGKFVTPEALNEVDGVLALALHFNRVSVQGVERCAVIARWGVGYDMIDVPALTEAGIALAITPNAVKRPVAEAILTFIFALTTNLFQQDRLVREGHWRNRLPGMGRNLAGRTLGSIGCGNIARTMFGLVQALGFGRLIAHDPYLDPETVKHLGVEMVSLDEVCSQSDFVTVNTFLNESTRGLVNERLLRLMKPTAFLINTARGPIVDQRALVRALNERWIAGAGLDVFEDEPILPDDPIRQCPNLIMTPHGLAWTEEIARDNTLEACANILTISRGEVPAAIVNKEVLDHPGFRKKLERFRSMQ
ncbi:MAG: dehydrogenase [Acidobacteria bacterium]|nr:dehydrogenase [Acidobacteriota bacterium]